MNLIEKTVKSIETLNENRMEEAQARLNNLSKPRGSLGKLEDIAIQLAGITGELYPVIENKYHMVMAGDHGVADEGVSAFPRDVTTGMVYNFLQGGAAINVLADQAGAQLKIVDIGVKNKINPDFIKENLQDNVFIERKIKAGTDNMARGPAMTGKEAVACIETGIDLTLDLIDSGADIIGTGEMGIANTTPSSAIVAAVVDIPLLELVGYGTGIDEEKRKHKKEVIARALTINQPDPEDGIDILTKVGGLEIGGMAGIMLGAASRRVPVVIDGLISAAAALIAYKIEPKVKEYFIASHSSVEPGHEKIYEYLGLTPMLNMNMRLGEGTGAVLAFNLVESACKIIANMATFDDLAKLDF